MREDYNYDYAYDARYCYPNSNVLINKLHITEKDALSVAEREITALRIAKAKLEPIKGNFDFAHLKAIHQYVFSDIFSWAGEVRSVNIAKGNQFCLCEHIAAYADDLFGKLKAENFLAEAPPDAMPERLAYYLSEINVLHPFREGNGRAQRLFIEYLADHAGYHVDFSDVSDMEMIVASAEAFACEYDKMNRMFRRITHRN